MKPSLPFLTFLALALALSAHAADVKPSELPRVTALNPEDLVVLSVTNHGAATFTSKTVAAINLASAILGDPVRYLPKTNAAAYGSNVWYHPSVGWWVWFDTGNPHGRARFGDSGKPLDDIYLYASDIWLCGEKHDAQGDGPVGWNIKGASLSFCAGMTNDPDHVFFTLDRQMYPSNIVMDAGAVIHGNASGLTNYPLTARPFGQVSFTGSGDLFNTGGTTWDPVSTEFAFTTAITNGFGASLATGTLQPTNTLTYFVSFAVTIQGSATSQDDQYDFAVYVSGTRSDVLTVSTLGPPSGVDLTVSAAGLLALTPSSTVLLYYRCRGTAADLTCVSAVLTITPP
jgi:hypothetical protein